MKRIFYFLVFVFLVTSARSQKPVTKNKANPKYHYLLYLPQKYDSTDSKHWPLIIYLHGKSACGNDLGKVKRYGLPFFTSRGMQLDAIAVSPQCPLGKNWSSENWLNPLMKELIHKYRIDTTRVYLTGMSLGGFGTWDLAIKYPHRFAAIAPLCGGGNVRQVHVLKDMPIWVFHGDRDERVPFKRSEEMVDALRACGGNPRFTVMKGFPHDIHRTYAEEKLYKWMLQYSLSTPFRPDPTLAYTDTVYKDNSPVPYYYTFKGKKAAPVAYQKNTQKKKKETQKPTKSDLQQTQPEKQKTIKEGIARDIQTDTVKSKDFMLVF